MVKYSANFIDEVESFNGKSLSQKKELQIIINVCSQNNLIEKLEDLSFTGKYISGLLRVLSSSSSIPEVKSLEHIKKDLSDNLEKIISQLKDVTAKMSEANKNIIQKKYLEISNDSLNNLKQLTEDLNSIKKYLNYNKRKQFD
jgi:hypothetical protein